MTDAGNKLAQDRANRTAARARFDTRVAQVRADLAARPIGGRIADKAGEEALGAASEAFAVARESKGIIAAVIAALALWFLRNPLIALVSRALSKQGAVKED